MKKKTLICLVLGIIGLNAFPQQNWLYTEAEELTLLGRLFDNNTNPYHRVDTTRYKGFSAGENLQVRMSAGISCAFRTNSNSIQVLTEYGTATYPSNTMGLAARGYDLYIKREGKWIYAASGVSWDIKKPITLIENLGDEEKECLLYFPLLSEVNSVKVGIENNARITPLEMPFRHRICFWGSSFTHGISTSRPGMTYPAQLSRATGWQALGLGCSGNCKLQPYFCEVLEDVQADAFVFDTFSNPSVKEIKERLEPFIQRMTKAHPGKPMVFQQTIFRENRNFNRQSESFESGRIRIVDSLMNIFKKKYRDVYFIHTNKASLPSHETSVDGIHPNDYGYTLWAESLKKPLMKILKKYGIE